MLDEKENPPIRSFDEGALTSVEGQWWVAHTKSRCEKALAADLFAAGIAYFLPMTERTIVWGGRKRRVLKVLFPSYLFFCGSEEDRQKAFATGHLFMTIPIHQREQFVRELAAIDAALSHHRDLELESLFEPGRLCRVVRGPLKGVEGTLLRRQGKSRLQLQVSIVGQFASVEIDAGMLEPVGPGEPLHAAIHAEGTSL